MEEINRLAAQRLPQELDTTFARSARSRELADLADHLADDARAIPDVLHDVRIPPDEARTFTDYAGRLEAQARELANLVRRGEHDRAAPKLAEITTTCNACHASFRILPLVQARE
jgi:cytochrome c556